MSLSLETRFRIRTLLFTITLATLPCYCAGFLLVDQVNRRSSAPTPTTTLPATRTPASLSEFSITPVPPGPEADPVRALELTSDWLVYTWNGTLPE